MITAYGNDGSITIDPVTGRVVSYEPSDEGDYSDIHSVDLTERRDFYLRHSIDVGFPQVGGDILDFRLVLKDGQVAEPELDYRDEILSEVYGDQ